MFMPEVLSKHPDVTIQVLQSAGAVCGPGQEQTILTACPPERFCSLPQGEMCVYGLEEAHSMTQISSADMREHLCAPLGKSSAAGCSLAPAVIQQLAEPLLLALLVGGLLVLRRCVRQGRRGRASRPS